MPQQYHNTPAADESVVERDDLAAGVLGWAQLPALVEGGSCFTSSGQEDSDEAASWQDMSGDEICWPAQELSEDPQHEDMHPVLRFKVESPSYEWWASNGLACPVP